MARFDYRVRYGECDQQGIVFNAHYLAYLDDAVDCWLRSLDPAFESALGWEVVVKRTEITWHSPARFGDTLGLELAVSRWGGTSFDVAATGRVGDRDVLTSVTTYVVVDHDTFRPVAVPAELQAHLDG
jgi:acyl-CoA thioester hydrolase